MTTFCDTGHHFLCPTPTPTTPITPTEPIDICTLPKEVGPCKGAFNRYYYNSIKGKCKQFIYSGCDGNANNFKTKKACKATCVHK